MRKLIEAIGWVAAGVILLLGLPIQAVLWVVTRPFDRNLVAPGKFLRFVGVMLSRTYPPWKLRVEGRWPDGRGSFVVVANHQSLLDVVLLARLPHEMKWVIKEELVRTPWIGHMMRLSGDIAVRRGDPESGGEAVAKAKAYLGRGMNVMIFPEGTRSRDARLLPFKKGAFRLAIDAGATVLPVVVTGTAQGFQKGGAKVGPCDAVARLLAPIPTTGLTQADAGTLRDRVRAAFVATLPAALVAPAPAEPAEEG